MEGAEQSMEITEDTPQNVSDAIRQKWEDTFDILEDIVTIHDLDNNIIRANKAALSSLNISLDQSSPVKCYEAFHGLSCSPEWCPVLEALKTGKVKTVEVFESHLGLHLEISATPKMSASGDVIGIVHIVRNITERKKAEDNLRLARAETEHLHRELQKAFQDVATAKQEWEKTIDCIHDMVMLIDIDGNIRRCNRPSADFFQLPYTDIVGRNWLELLKSRGVTISCATDREVEVCQEQTDRTFEIRLSPIQGEDIWLSTSVTIRDISERRALEEKIALDEDRFEALWNLSQMQDSSVDELVDFALESAVHLTRSSGGYFHFMNEDQQSMNLYSWSREVLKECKTEKTPHYPISQAGVWADCVRLRKPVIHNDYSNLPGRRGLPPGHFEVRRHMSIPVFEGERIVAVAGVGNKARPYHDGDVKQLFLFMNDLWSLLKQKKQANELKLKNEQLEKAYVDLKAARVQAFQQEKLASIGQIAAGVAHEINNPTSFIMSNLGSLQRYVEKLTEFLQIEGKAVAGLPPEQLEEIAGKRNTLKVDFVLDDIHGLIRESLDGAERIKKIVQDLKSFSRVDESEQKMVDINAGIESTVNIVWNELKYKAVVKKEYGDIPQTKCNPGQLNQVFMNILVNAAHAIEKEGEIAIRTWEENGFINIAISDTGSGIPEDRIPRIFEPFYTTKEVGKGTCLGLSIAYDIVKKHGGTIMVQSEVGKGTTFTVSIPHVEANS